MSERLVLEAGGFSPLPRPATGPSRSGATSNAGVKTMSNFKFAFRAKKKIIDFVDGLDEDQLKANPELPEKLKGFRMEVTPMTLDKTQQLAARASALDEIEKSPR